MHVLTRQQSSTAYGVSQGHPSSSHARTSLPSPRGRTRTAPSRQDFLYTSVACTTLGPRAATVTIFLSNSAALPPSRPVALRGTQPWPAPDRLPRASRAPARCCRSCPEGAASIFSSLLDSHDEGIALLAVFLRHTELAIAQDHRITAMLQCH